LFLASGVQSMLAVWQYGHDFGLESLQTDRALFPPTLINLHLFKL
jgi:hypothetical protein